MNRLRRDYRYYQKLSDVQLSQGDVLGALRSCRTSRDLAGPLGSSGPTDDEWLRDLSTSYWSIGEFQLSNGDKTGALNSYREALDICQQLSAIDPTKPIWKRGLAFAYEKLGGAQLSLDDLSGAMTSYQETLEIAKSLVAAETTNPELNREMSVSYEKIGDVYYEQKDWRRAMHAQRAALAIRQHIAVTFPDSAQSQQDLVVTFEKLAAVAQKMNDPEMRGKYRQQSLETSRAVRAQLELSELQLQEVSHLQRESFAKFCKQLGYDPAEHAQLVLKTSQGNLRRLIEVQNARNPELAETHQRLVQELLDADDFWTFKELQNQRTRESIVKHIVEHARILPIHYDYLHSLCQQLYVSPPEPDEPDSLRLFLESIPTLVLSQLDFNAFVEHRTLVDNVIPCVCVSEQLITATDVFFDVVLHVSISKLPTNQVDATQPSVCTERGSQRSFQDTCRSCVDMVLGSKDWIELEYENALRSDPVMQLPFALMGSGARNWIWYHEYGHLLMGHLLTGPCHEVEFDADLFAWRLVNMHVDQASNAAFWNSLGVFTLFVLFEILEKILQRPRSTTHPAPRDRMRRLLSTLCESDRRTIYRCLQSVISTCNPTLSRFWNVTLDPYDGQGVH